MDYQIDSTDARILNILTKDAKTPFVKVSKMLNISNSLVHQRVKKMEENGILQAPIYLLNPENLGYNTSAFTNLIVAHAKYLPSIIKELEKIPEIVECVNLVGRYAIMVKIFAKNNVHLREIVYHKIQRIEGVEETNTTITFETNFTRPLQLE